MNQFNNSLAPKKTPKAFVVGDYVAWRNSGYVTDYPPASYTMAYVFRREGDPARKFTVTGTTDSDEFLFQITTTETLEIEAGLYFWDLQVTQNSDSERVTLDQGTLRVQENKATDSGDPRTLPRKMVAEIERAILSRATNNQLDTLAYTLGVESSATRDTEKLNAHRDYWRAELIKANRKWRARNGLRHSGKIRAQF
jgi:hypothetical protein